MGKLYSLTIRITLLLIAALAGYHSEAISLAQKNAPKPSVAANSNFQTDTIPRLNVKVYPVPVTDQINVSYTLNKEANVTIMLRDILGNQVTTLLSRRQPAGAQKNTFPLVSRLTPGHPYLIQVNVANHEPVYKRIFAY
jgi:hypothetical protein